MPIDKTRYPPNWEREIVPRIMRRSGGKCEQCGIANHSTVYSVYLKVQDTNGRYKSKAHWFVFRGDALRACRFNRELIKEVYVKLAVCHLDHDEVNHQVTDERLMCLCQHCHTNLDAGERYKRRTENNTDTLKRGCAS